jgi:hypothetical protein
MAMMTSTATSNGRTTVAPLSPLRRRRRRGPILLGALLVLVGAVAFAVTSLRVDPRSAVLALAAPVTAGHVLTDVDLTVARIVPDPTVSVVAASARSSVLGRTVTMPLAAHTLLSMDEVGPTAWPPAGQAVAAVPVKAGHAPAGLAPGAQVTVVTVGTCTAPTSQNTSSGGSSSAGSGLQLRATLVAVKAPDANGTSVVSLLLVSSDAVKLAGASGDVALVLGSGR